jgi:hypothetical protein
VDWGAKKHAAPVTMRRQERSLIVVRVNEGRGTGEGVSMALLLMRGSLEEGIAMIIDIVVMV